MTEENQRRAIAQLVLDAAKRIEEDHQFVRDVAESLIPDFHFMDHEVSLRWRCDKSPIGMCVFRLNENGQKTYCRYCGGPVERK